jgi:hypothetical protein
MHLFMLLPLLLQPSAPPDLDARIAVLTASAAAHHDAGAYAAAANDYLKLASLPRADGETALKQAHLNLDAAFVQTSDVVHLCHALGVARRRIAMGGFKSDQARLSWEERAADDEARLAAADGHCPSASASPPPAAAGRGLERHTPTRRAAHAHRHAGRGAPRCGSTASESADNGRRPQPARRSPAWGSASAA